MSVRTSFVALTHAVGVVGCLLLALAGAVGAEPARAGFWFLAALVFGAGPWRRHRALRAGRVVDLRGTAPVRALG